MIGILCAWFNIAICVGFPTVVFVFILLKSKPYLKFFLVGVCTYLISQLCIRQPFILALESIDAYRIFKISNPVGYLLFLSVTAALVEEIGRYIAFRFVIKDHDAKKVPFYYGFGHGGIEAVSVGINNIVLVIFFSDFLVDAGGSIALAGIERISAQIAQIAFSYVVFYAFRKKAYRYLVLAIVIHTAYNFSMVLLNYGISAIVLEVLLLVCSVLLLLITFKYNKGVSLNEEDY